MVPVQGPVMLTLCQEVVGSSGPLLSNGCVPLSKVLNLKLFQETSGTICVPWLTIPVLVK